MPEQPTLLALLALALTAANFIFGFYTFHQKAAQDRLSIDEDRIERLETQLAQCRRGHSDLQRQLNDLRGENEWLRNENIRMRRGEPPAPEPRADNAGE